MLDQAGKASPGQTLGYSENLWTTVKKSFKTLGPGANVINILSVICKFLYYAEGFVRLGWKSLRGTKTLAYHENLKIT